MKRDLLPDPSADKSGVVDHPLRTGPFPFDVLSSAFLYLDDHDLRSLMAISQVCSYWRWVSNLLPQWTPALHSKIPDYGSYPLRVRDKGMHQLKIKVEEKRRRKREEAERQEQREKENIRSDFISDIHNCRRLESILYVILIVLAIGTVGMWIGAMASNREWPAFTEGGSLKNSVRLRRFAGYPGLCLGYQFESTCEDDEGNESSCTLWNWDCRAMKDVVAEGPSQAFSFSSGPTSLLAARSAWICKGSTEQLNKFRKAADYQVAGMSTHIIFSLILAFAHLLAQVDSIKSIVSTSVAIFGTLGLGMCSALMLASLPIIDELYTTKCSPSHPTAEDLGWKRSDDMMAAFNAMSLLCVLISTFIFFSREVYVCMKLRRRRG